jgi:hypothetical protein
MKTHECDQEPIISRIEKKVDSIDDKLDSFLNKTTRLETQMGFIKTGFTVIIAPLLIYVLTKLI